MGAGEGGGPPFLLIDSTAGTICLVGMQLNEQSRFFQYSQDTGYIGYTGYRHTGCTGYTGYRIHRIHRIRIQTHGIHRIHRVQCKRYIGYMIN